MEHKETLLESRHRFGSRIKELRKEQHLTQLQLGQIVGLNRSQISRLECGEVNATFDTILLVAGGLGVSPSDLFTEVGTPFLRHREPPPVMLGIPRNRTIGYHIVGL